LPVLLLRQQGDDLALDVPNPGRAVIDQHVPSLRELPQRESVDQRIVADQPGGCDVLPVTRIALIEDPDAELAVEGEESGEPQNAYGPLCFEDITGKADLRENL